MMPLDEAIMKISAQQPKERSAVMERQAERERLYELIDKFDVMSVPTDGFRHSLADYLLANGVIVPLCKVGDTVYFLFDGNVHNVRVQGIAVGHNGSVMLNFGGYPVQYAWASEVGKTVFLTREEAEAALVEHK